MSWRVARSLDALLAEINEAAPNRSKISDGSIGDAAHASRSSDHNPWIIDHNGVGVVRARDFTHDPGGGLDCNELAHALAQIVSVGGHPAARSGAYIIWRRQILSFDRRSEGWRPYTGSNPHDKHLHLSVATAAAGYDSGARWGVMHEEDIMASIEDLRRVVRDEVAPIKRKLDLSLNLQRTLRSRVNEARAGIDDLEKGAKDDATKGQAHQLRLRLDEILATLDEADDGSPRS